MTHWRNSTTIPRLSMTTVIFHDFQGLENSFLNFHDFPGCMGTLHLELQDQEAVMKSFSAA